MDIYDTAIGLLYDGECLPKVSDLMDPFWLSVQYQHQTAYIEKDASVIVQSCSGNAPANHIGMQSKVTTIAAPTRATTTTTSTTSTHAPTTTITTTLSTNTMTTPKQTTTTSLPTTSTTTTPIPTTTTPLPIIIPTTKPKPTTTTTQPQNTTTLPPATTKTPEPTTTIQLTKTTTPQPTSTTTRQTTTIPKPATTTTIPITTTIPRPTSTHMTKHVYTTPTATNSSVGPYTQGDTHLCPGSVQQKSKQNNYSLAQHGDSCYELQTNKVIWEHGEYLCKHQGGRMVAITSAAEQAFVEAFMARHNPDHAVWIGLHDRNVEGQFEWCSGEGVTYTNWVPNHMSNFESYRTEDCVILITYLSFQWDDIPCGFRDPLFGFDQGEKHYTLCEYNVSSGHGSNVLVG